MSLERLSDSVYGRIGREISTAADSNRGYIVCDEYVVVVDTTHHLERIKEELKELREITRRKIGYVVNTHYHYDHISGNGLFRCPIVAHARCRSLMKEMRERQLANALDELTDRKLRKELKALRPRYPNILFDESYQLVSKPRIEIMHMGGHTPDLSIVCVPEEKVLFASDNLFGSTDPSTPCPPEMNSRSDLSQWISALRRMLDLEANVIVPGHWRISNRQAVSKLIDYLELFAARVREMKAKGHSKEEVKGRLKLLDLPRLIAETAIQHSIEENNVEAQYDLL